MKKYRPALIIGLIVSIVSGCYYDKSDLLFPAPVTSPVGTLPNGCDTANMKFTANIKPILDAYCVSCHTQGGQAGNVWNIQNFGTFQAKALNGTLLYRITLPQTDPLKMPRGLGNPKLDTCNILKIRAWVNRGAINN